jgi:hypothetical protein
VVYRRYRNGLIENGLIENELIENGLIENRTISKLFLYIIIGNLI